MGPARTVRQSATSRAARRDSNERNYTRRASGRPTGEPSGGIRVRQKRYDTGTSTRMSMGDSPPKSTSTICTGDCTLTNGGTVKADGSMSRDSFCVAGCQWMTRPKTDAIGAEQVTSNGAVNGNTLSTTRLKAKSRLITAATCWLLQHYRCQGHLPRESRRHRETRRIWRFRRRLDEVQECSCGTWAGQICMISSNFPTVAQDIG